MSYFSKRDIKANNAMFIQAVGNQMYTREYDILPKICKFFSVPGNLDRVIPYIEDSGNDFSLRDFEAFNVHVAPWMNVRYYVEQVYPGTNGKKFKDIFIVYQKYKAQLKCYNKETFDPFRRGISFEFFYTRIDPDTKEKTHHSVFTAICQLNYFMWCINNGVLDYIENNKVLIERAIKEIDKTRKSMKREEFKELIEEKQRKPRCYMTQNLQMMIPRGPITGESN